MKKLNYKNILLITISAIITIITLFTFYKVNLNHKNKLYESMDKKIKETALKCYNEEKCEDHILIKELYEKEYLTELINPINNEFISEDTYIDIKSPTEASITYID